VATRRPGPAAADGSVHSYRQPHQGSNPCGFDCKYASRRCLQSPGPAQMEAADAAAVRGWMDYLEGLAGALLAAARRWAEAHAGAAEGGAAAAAAAAADALPGPRLLADSLFMHDLREARARGWEQGPLGGVAGRAAAGAAARPVPAGAQPAPWRAVRGVAARATRHGLDVGMWGELLRKAWASARHRPCAMRSRAPWQRRRRARAARGGRC